jgi:hypothetical protein
MKKQIIFNVTGGIGKNIMATAVVSSIKKAYPDRDIIVTTAWLEPWQNNPHIAKAISFENTDFFFRDYIKGTDTKLFMLDPYQEDNFKSPLIQIWCDLCKVPYDGSLPQLYYTEQEKETIRKKLYKDPLDKRPLFFIQTSGGAATQERPFSWARDLPLSIAEKVVNNMVEKGYRAIHFRRKEQPALPNTDWMPFNYREGIGAVMFSDKRLFIDSVAAHAATAFGKTSVVTWVVTSPQVFGYPTNTNLVTKKQKEFRHLAHAGVFPYDFSGLPIEYPFNDEQIFSVDEIMKALGE